MHHDLGGGGQFVSRGEQPLVKRLDQIPIHGGRNQRPDLAAKVVEEKHYVDPAPNSRKRAHQALLVEVHNVFETADHKIRTNGAIAEHLLEPRHPAQGFERVKGEKLDGLSGIFLRHLLGQTVIVIPRRIGPRIVIERRTAVDAGQRICFDLPVRAKTVIDVFPTNPPDIPRPATTFLGTAIVRGDPFNIFGCLAKGRPRNAAGGQFQLQTLAHFWRSAKLPGERHTVGRPMRKGCLNPLAWRKPMK